MTLFHPKLPKLDKTFLLSSLPKTQDIFLVNKNLGELIEQAKNVQSSPIYQKLASSGFLEVVVFPLAIECPELVVECANHYDPNTRCIKEFSGEVLVRISETSVSSALRIPHKEPYEPWTFEKPEHLYCDRKKNYDSVVAQTWLLRPAEGGSRFPKPLTIEHFIKEIVDIMLLLNRVKGNARAFLWESWMYLFIQKIVEGEKFIDWADLIAENLHRGLIIVISFSSFFLYSFLVYILAASKEWEGLPHMP